MKFRTILLGVKIASRDKTVKIELITDDNYARIYKLDDYDLQNDYQSEWCSEKNKNTYTQSLPYKCGELDEEDGRKIIKLAIDFNPQQTESIQIICNGKYALIPDVVSHNLLKSWIDKWVQLRPFVYEDYETAKDHYSKFVYAQFQNSQKDDSFDQHFNNLHTSVIESNKERSKVYSSKLEYCFNLNNPGQTNFNINNNNRFGDSFDVDQELEDSSQIQQQQQDQLNKRDPTQLEDSAHFFKFKKDEKLNNKKYRKSLNEFKGRFVGEEEPVGNVISNDNYACGSQVAQSISLSKNKDKSIIKIEDNTIIDVDHATLLNNDCSTIKQSRFKENQFSTEKNSVNNSNLYTFSHRNLYQSDNENFGNNGGIGQSGQNYEDDCDCEEDEEEEEGNYEPGGDSRQTIENCANAMQNFTIGDSVEQDQYTQSNRNEITKLLNNQLHKKLSIQICDEPVYYLNPSISDWSDIDDEKNYPNLVIPPNLKGWKLEKNNEYKRFLDPNETTEKINQGWLKLKQLNGIVYIQDTANSHGYKGEVTANDDREGVGFLEHRESNLQYIYEGKFKANQKHGYGKSYKGKISQGHCESAPLRYKGIFQCDKPEGYGIVYSDNGKVTKTFWTVNEQGKRLQGKDQQISICYKNFEFVGKTNPEKMSYCLGVSEHGGSFGLFKEGKNVCYIGEFRTGKLQRQGLGIEIVKTQRKADDHILEKEDILEGFLGVFKDGLIQRFMKEDEKKHFLEKQKANSSIICNINFNVVDV